MKRAVAAALTRRALRLITAVSAVPAKWQSFAGPLEGVDASTLDAAFVEFAQAVVKKARTKKVSAELASIYSDLYVELTGSGSGRAKRWLAVWQKASSR